MVKGKQNEMNTLLSKKDDLKSSLSKSERNIDHFRNKLSEGRKKISGLK